MNLLSFFCPKWGGKTSTGPSWQLHVVCALQRGYLRVTRPLRGLGLKIFIWKCDSVPGSRHSHSHSHSNGSGKCSCSGNGNDV